MHPTQLEILNSLRQADSRRFSELLHDVAETSDNLTYHVKKLQRDDFIDSPEKGVYVLAQKGIIYLNNNLELSHDLFPTVSCMLELHNPDNEILVMKKLKRPYLGKLHLLTFGVTSSKSLDVQIKDFLDRYHIEANGISFKAVHRERTPPVFDKFFVVFRGKFLHYQHKIEDRQFLALDADELTASPETLSATKAVLNLGGQGDFTEATAVEAP